MKPIESSSTAQQNSGRSKLSLKQESAIDELVISSGNEEFDDETEDQTVLATSQNGDTLTLLEEYSLRETKGRTTALLLAIIWAAVSLSFAFLNYTKL